MKLDAGLMTSLPASDPGSAAVWGSKRINPRPQSCLCLTWSGYPSNDDETNKFSARVSNYIRLGFIVLYVLKNGSNECKKRLTAGFHIAYLVLQDLRTTPTEDGQISSLVNKTIEDWMATKPTWKAQFQLESFPVFHRRAWVEVFIKYNTGIPSSAAIERVFSVGSDVIKPKRATLSSENFERLIFNRENENCLIQRKKLINLFVL